MSQISTTFKRHQIRPDSSRETTVIGISKLRSQTKVTLLKAWVSWRRSAQSRIKSVSKLSVGQLLSWSIWLRTIELVHKSTTTTAVTWPKSLLRTTKRKYCQASSIRTKISKLIQTTHHIYCRHFHRIHPAEPQTSIRLSNLNNRINSRAIRWIMLIFCSNKQKSQESINRK